MSRNASEVSSRSLPITQREGGRSNRNTSAEIKNRSSSTSSRSNPNLNPLIEQPSRPKPVSAFGTSPDAATAAAVPGKRSAMMRSMRRLNASTRSSISIVDSNNNSGGSDGAAIPARTRHSIGAISSSSSGSGPIRLAHQKRSQVAGTSGGRKSLLARDSRNASMPNIYHNGPGQVDTTRPTSSRRASADAVTRTRPTSGSSEEQREERRIWDEMERRRLERQRIRDREKDDERRLSNQMQKHDSKRSLGSATSSSGRDSSLSNSSLLTAQQRNHIQQEQSFRSLGTNVTSDSHVSQSSIISEQDVIANEFAQLRRMSIRESIGSSDNISANNPGSYSQQKQQQQRSRSLGAITAVEQTNYIDEDERLAAELQAQFDRENEAFTHDGGHRIETTELYDGTTLRVIERQNHDGPMAANNSAANRRVICAGCRGRFRVSEGCELLMCPSCDTLTPV